MPPEKTPSTPETEPREDETLPVTTVPPVSFSGEFRVMQDVHEAAGKAKKTESAESARLDLPEQPGEPEKPLSTEGDRKVPLVPKPTTRRKLAKFFGSKK